MKTVRQFLRDENGASAIEYGLIVAGIALAVISIPKGLGHKLHSTFAHVQAGLK
ncbi:MAG: Flp family type IVb pilin [Candidatus Sulfotelmatobacter sp.]